MKVSELQKQLTDYLVNYGDDQILVTAKPELESWFQPFEIGPSSPMEGFPRVAIMDVPPSVLGQYKQLAEKNCADASPEKEGEKKEENHPSSLQEAIKTIREENEALLSELPAAIRRIAALLKDEESPDPEQEATEKAESALEKFLKETSSSGPASIQIRVSL